MEDAVDIIEDVLLGYAASVLLAGRGEDPVGHAVAADVAVCIALLGREEVGNIRRAVIIPIERETLSVANSLIFWYIIYNKSGEIFRRSYAGNTNYNIFMRRGWK